VSDQERDKHSTAAEEDSPEDVEAHKHAATDDNDADAGDDVEAHQFPKQHGR
jgi:hypothetical protein